MSIQVAATERGDAASNEAMWRVPVQHECVLRDFSFHTGEVVPELRIAFTVLGNPQGQPVLALHGTGGTGESLLTREFGGELFGPGGPLDAADHFIVLPDAIGHGRSAKPSDGLRTRFARYNYDDIVQSQSRLLREVLGLPRLRLVLGVSMGGMLAWLWGIRHPDAMDALVPLAASPSPMAGRNWLLRRLLADQIRSDPAWEQGEYRMQPPGARRAWEFFNVATNGGTLALHAAAPTRAAADRWLETKRAAPFETDANDLLYQYEAARDYDPSEGLARIRAAVLAILSADDERNPPELRSTETALAHLPRARHVVLPADGSTAGHGTVRKARLWSETCRHFLASLPPATRNTQA